MNRFVSALLASAVLILAGCDSSEVSETSIVYRVQLNTASSAQSSAKAAPDVAFDSGYITIREVVFDATTPDVSISHEQVVKIDFATGASTPPIEPVTIPAGSYADVDLGIELQDENDIPSMLLEGVYTRPDNSTVPVRFEFNSGEVFEASGEAVTIAEGAEATGLITIDPTVWFSTITTERLDNAQLTDGVLVASDVMNAEIFSDVADRLDVATDAKFSGPGVVAGANQ